MKSDSLIIHGKPVDTATRCVHYHSEKDIVAIKFKCCENYYPCFECHQETTQHETQVWLKSERHQKAILCGECRHEMTIHEYLLCNYRCPSCKAIFNENCSRHYPLYFEI